MIVNVGKKPVITRSVLWTRMMKKIITCQVSCSSYNLGTTVYCLVKILTNLKNSLTACRVLFSGRIFQRLVGTMKREWLRL